MKEELQHIINTTNPKQVSQTVKRNSELFTQVNCVFGNTIAEKIYNTLTPNQHTCKYGNLKKFDTIATGYRNCGHARKCVCSKESVAAKVSESKQNYSTETKLAINEKRVATSLEKYGVTNNGQTAYAKSKHAELYADRSQVDKINIQVAQTKLALYNDASYNNSDKIKDTYKQKRESGYWYDYRPDKKLRKLDNPANLAEMYNTMTVYEIAEHCNVHPNTVHRYLSTHKVRPIFTSSYEQELINFLKSLGITNIVSNKRRLISIKKEIDIFLPDYNLAIEYNGVYWHHDKIPHITKTYHYDKFKSCEEGGIQLLTIFSHVWDTKKDTIKRAIIHKLGLNTSSRIFARKCQIHEISSTTSKEFLETNHVQGYTRAGISYGLYYESNLVAVMTFSKRSARPGIGRNSSDEWELVRYASNASVVGGASKLLNRFIKLNNPAKIQSYSSNEWSNGSLYAKLGFTFEHEVKPGYWYFDPKRKTMHHRYNFAKHVLVEAGYDANLTEFEITDQIGLLRIWDCGNRSWTMDLSK